MLIIEINQEVVMLKKYIFILPLYTLITSVNTQAMEPSAQDSPIKEVTHHSMWQGVEKIITSAKTLNEALKRLHKLPLPQSNADFMKVLIETLYTKFPYTSEPQTPPPGAPPTFQPGPLITYHTREQIAQALNAKAWLDEQQKRAQQDRKLMAAAYEGNLNTIKELLSQSADINGHFSSLIPPLYAAMHQHHLDIVKYLLDQRADVNQRYSQYTPLTFAIHHFPEAVSLLLAKGADITLTDPSGKTALALAQEKGNTEVVKLLRNAAVKAPVISQ